MAKFCTSCGQGLQEGMNNCPNCGAPIRVDVNTTQNMYNTNVSGVPTDAKSKIAGGLKTSAFFISFSNFKYRKIKGENK